MDITASGWATMLGDKWLSHKIIRAATDEQLATARRYPNVACVGVNSQRVRREQLKRAAKRLTAATRCQYLVAFGEIAPTVTG